MHTAVVIFFLTLFSLYGEILAQPPSPTNPTFDHYWFVMTWPNGFCSSPSSGCSSTPQFLVLHGLWPAYSTGVIPTECNHPIKDPRPIIGTLPPQLKNDMDRLWFSIGRFRTNQAFWAHQWRQHGTCQVSPPKNYFENVITLRKSIDLDSAIKAAVPTGQSAPRENFVNAIKTKLGDVVPVLRCVDKNGNKLLSEIIICINRAGTRAISCDAELPHDNCGTTTIKFPAQTE